MAGSKAKSKRTVGEWEAEIDTRDKRIGLLELAIYDLQFAVGYGTTEPKFGKPIEVEVRHTEHGMERGLKLHELCDLPESERGEVTEDEDGAHFILLDEDGEESHYCRGCSWGADYVPLELEG